MPPQSAPAMHCSHSYPQQSAHMMPHHSAPFGMGGPYYAAYTPPPTPNTASAGTSTSSAAFGWHGHIHSPLSSTSTPLSAPVAPKMRLQRSQSDAARR